MRKVTIYSTKEDCHYCDELHRILSKYKIKHRIVKWSRADNKINEKFKKLTGETRVRFPITKINAKIVIGYDLLEIARILKLEKGGKNA